MTIPPSDRSPDLICLSHLRWNFVYQRPQHLMSRFARERRVFFVEEPIFEADGEEPRLSLERGSDGVWVAVPHLPVGLDPRLVVEIQRRLLDRLFADQRVEDYVLWFYTPMAMAFCESLKPRATVYDCMDELSAFANAPPALREHEARLLARADVVFTGGYSLYEAKRDAHSNVHPFPSSVDVPHFARARVACPDPADQAAIARPRLGFFGVIDERMDLALLGRLAAARPDWQLVLLGPVVKIDPATLPRAANIHYLGSKKYDELPRYLAGWDVALMPFARNASTRYISPTKTPEYLAAGKPVVSTSIRDVVRFYGDPGLVEIADDAEGFARAVERALAGPGEGRRRAADRLLARMSWDRTHRDMSDLLDEAVAHNEGEVAACSTT